MRGRLWGCYGKVVDEGIGLGWAGLGWWVGWTVGVCMDGWDWDRDGG